METNQKLFALGQVVVTPSVQQILGKNLKFTAEVFKALKRHSKGEWGDVSAMDRETNETALKEDERLFSVYKIDPEIWIITERDRSVTTILFPEDY